MNHWGWLLVAILAEVVATTALKASAGFSRWSPSLLVVFGYGVAFYGLSLVLKAMPMGITYAVWSGVGLALITLVGWVVYGQSLDAWGLVGIILIVSGVLVLNLLSSTTH